METSGDRGREIPGGRDGLRDLVGVLLIWAFWSAWYAPAVFGGRVPLAEDTLGYFFANRANLYAMTHGGGFSWWDPLPMLGQPRLANIQSGSFSPISLLFYLLPTSKAFVFFPVLVLGLLSSFTFGLFRVKGVGRIPALFGALSWSTIGNLMTHVQHASAIDTLVWLPATLLAWELSVRSRAGVWRKSGWAVLAGFGLAFQCFGALPQFMLYNGLVMAFWIGLSLWRLQRSGGAFMRHAGIAAGVAVIGFGVASWQLLPFLEMVQHSHRSLLVDVAAFRDHYRAAPQEVLLALAAEVFVWIEAPTLAHGAPYRNLPNLSLLTVAWAIFAVRRRPRAVPEWAFAVFFLVGMLGSMGGVTTFIGSVFPFAGRVRAPIRMIVPAAFWISWLAALGMHRWLGGASHRRALLGAAAVVWLALLGWGLHRVSQRYVDESVFRIPEVVQNASPRVVMDLRGSQDPPLFALNMGIAAGLPTVLMREPLIPRNFFEAWFASQLGSLEQRWRRVDYVINSLMLPLSKPSMPILRAFRLSTLIRFRDGDYHTIPLPGVVDRFRFVSEVAVAGEPQRRWALAASDKWDPESLVIVSEPIELPSSPLHETDGEARDDLPARLRVILDEPDRQVFEVESPGGVAVTSDLFFPGWEVRLDGAPARPLEVDLALRGVVVPAGRHRVEWTYRPTWLPMAWGGTVLAVASCLAIMLGLRSRGRQSA